MNLLTMSVGVDVDSVLSDPHPVWVKEFAAFDREHGHTYPSGIDRKDALKTSWTAPFDVCGPCFERCISTPETILQHPIIPGALAAMATMATHFQISLVTHRPDSVHAATWQWLHNNSLMPYIKDVIFSSDKASICRDRQLACLIDDAPSNFEAVLATGQTVPILFDQPWNKHVKTDFRAMDWGVAMGMAYTIFGRFYVHADESHRINQEMVETGSKTGDLERPLVLA